MRLFKRVLLVLLFLSVIVVGGVLRLQNTTAVPLSLPGYQFAAQPLALWLIGAFVLGGSLGMLSCSVALMRVRSSRKLLSRKLERSEKELFKLRSSTTVAAVPRA